MKTIKLKSLKTKNFKSLYNTEINFGEKNTNIYGKNGVGKSSLFDAFLWVLFGKDAQDRKDFEIKTKKINGMTIDMQDVEVEIILEVNNKKIKLCRIYKEKWTKKHGSEKQEFSGHVTEYLWNDVPKQAKDYQLIIDDICDENVFKLITNPLYFNTKLKWEERRDFLTKISGDISVFDIAGTNKNYLEIVDEINSGKSLEDLKAMHKASVKKSKEKLENIPIRISEVNRSIGELKSINFVSKETELKDKLFELDQLESSLEDFNKKLNEQKNIKIEIQNKEIHLNSIINQTKQQAADSFKQDLSKIQEIELKIKSVTNLLTDKDYNLKLFKQQLETLKTQKESTNIKIENYRKQWTINNAEQPKYESSDCPTCGKPIDDYENKKIEIQRVFDTNKKIKLEEIVKNADYEKANLKNIEDQINQKLALINKFDQEISENKKDIEILENDKTIENKKVNLTKPTDSQIEAKTNELLTFNISYQTLKNEISNLEKKVKNLNQPKDVINSKNELLAEISEIKIILSKKENLFLHIERVKELSNEEKILAQEINNAEKKEFDIENFVKIKAEKVEEQVNKLFSISKFKMFETQINGGLKNICECNVNGVPFPAINTARKINAGLDCINVLSNFFNVSAPIFIDNRESVTEIIPTNSQIINLIVDNNSETLTLK